MIVTPNRRTVLTVLLAFVPRSCFLFKADERVDIIIAATDLAAGRQITDRGITITSIPVSAIIREMPRKSSEVTGHKTGGADFQGRTDSTLESELMLPK